MNETFGATLGGFLATLEEDLVETGCDHDPLTQIRQISEIYRNMTQGGFHGFQNDFQEGYTATKRGILEDRLVKAASDFPSPTSE